MHAHPKSNLAVAKEHSAKVRLCKEAHTVQHSAHSAVRCVRNNKQQAKYGPCTLVKVFFLILEIFIVRVTKVTAVNQSIIEEYI